MMGSPFFKSTLRSEVSREANGFFPLKENTMKRKSPAFNSYKVNHSNST
jgi:hypothetical protein